MLPPNEYTFHFKSKGDKTQKNYEGDFTVKCVLTNEESVDVAIRTDRYCAGSKTLPAIYAMMCRVMAELEVRIKKAPDWWKESDSGRLLQDQNVLYEIFNEANKGEEDWVKRVKTEADGIEKDTKKRKKEKTEAKEQEQES